MVAPRIEHRARLSARAQLVHEAARWVARPLVTAWPMTPAALRALPVLEGLAALRKAPPGTRTELVRLAGFLAEWVRAEGVGHGRGPGRADPAEGAILYFHGGAFIGGGMGTHRRCVSALSRTARRPVLSVAYRQYPATRLTGSVADGLFAYRWLLRRGHPPERIVLAGDSAGGYLAFAVTLAARAEGLPVPAGLVGMSPLLDWDGAVRGAHRNLRRDAYIPGWRLPALYRLIAPLDGPVDPMLSPVNHDLRGMPPTLLQVAAGEVLRCDSEAMAARLAESGVDCTLQIWQGQVHAFPVLAGLLPEAMAALGEVGSFVRRVTAPASATAATGPTPVPTDRRGVGPDGLGETA